MSEEYRVLRVLVSSPDDVADERVIAKEVIKQVNQILAHNFLGIHLEFVGWETATAPGFGTEPQAVINEQIGDDYDIFIGILWTRFGTTTKSAGSGTEEEFLRAYKRHQEDSSQIRIMFYFSGVPVVWYDQDLSQMELIRKFRDGLPEKGGLYGTYKSQKEFEEILRLHLAQQIKDWGKGWGKGKKKQLTEVVEVGAAEAVELVDELDESPEVSPPSDEGFLDLIESGTDQMSVVADATNRMTDALQDLGERMEKRTSKFEELGEPSSKEDLHRWRVAIEATASDLMDFVKRMEIEIPTFGQAYSDGIGAYGRAAVLLGDFTSTDRSTIEGAKNTVTELRNTIEGARQSTRAFRTTVHGFPRVSTSFNQARNKAVVVLDQLDREYHRAIALASEVEASLESILEDFVPAT